MKYDFIAIPDEEVPRAIEPLFQHLVTTYASETNKTAGVWRAIPDDLLDFRPHEKTNTIRAILVHQILSERRFFAQFIGIEEPPAEDLLPTADQPTRPGLPGSLRASGEAAIAANRLGERRLVDGGGPFLRRIEPAADLDILATALAHLPPPDAGPDLAPVGRSQRPPDLRAIRRRQRGRR